LVPSLFLHLAAVPILLFFISRQALTLIHAFVFLAFPMHFPPPSQGSTLLPCCPPALSFFISFELHAAPTSFEMSSVFAVPSPGSTFAFLLSLLPVRKRLRIQIKMVSAWAQAPPPLPPPPFTLFFFRVKLAPRHPTPLPFLFSSLLKDPRCCEN